MLQSASGLSIEDVATAHVSAFVAGIRPSTLAGCRGVGIAPSVVAGAHVAYLGSVRPYASRLEQLAAMILAILQLGIGVAVVLALHVEGTWPVTLLGVFQLAFDAASFVVLIGVAVISIRGEWASLRQKGSDSEASRPSATVSAPLLQLQARNPLLNA